MKHNYSASCDILRIRPLQREDLESLRLWRNDFETSIYLRKIDYISQEQQLQWFENYLRQPDIYFWSVVKEKILIGALSIYDVSEQQANIGKIMIGNKSERGRGYGYMALTMAMAIGFEKLNLEVINLEVHEKNLPALSMYKRAGFRVIARHEFELRMQITNEIFRRDNYMLVNNIKVSWGGVQE